MGKNIIPERHETLKQLAVVLMRSWRQDCFECQRSHSHKVRRGGGGRTGGEEGEGEEEKEGEGVEEAEREL